MNAMSVCVLCICECMNDWLFNWSYEEFDEGKKEHILAQVWGWDQWWMISKIKT